MPDFLDSLSIRRSMVILVIILAWMFGIGSKDIPSIFTIGISSSHKIGNPELLECIIPKNILIIFFWGLFSSLSKYSVILPVFSALHIERASFVGLLSGQLRFSSELSILTKFLFQRASIVDCCWRCSLPVSNAQFSFIIMISLAPQRKKMVKKVSREYQDFIKKLTYKPEN